MDLFEALREDHDRQRNLLEKACATVGESDGREELLEQIKLELTAHAAAEERYFYTHLFGSDLTQDKARHSVHEHEQIDDKLEQLAGYDLSAPAWILTAEELRDLVEHHLDEEEQEVFQLAGKALDDSAKEHLAGEYREAMEAERP